MTFIKSELVVGHDLRPDFAALSINQTGINTFDTSKEIKLRERAKLPPNKKPSLRKLYHALTGIHRLILDRTSFSTFQTHCTNSSSSFSSADDVSNYFGFIIFRKSNFSLKCYLKSNNQAFTLAKIQNCTKS